MEPDRSVQITWPLAAQEAILGEFAFIEPVHLLLAALKFAEVGDEQMRAIAGQSGAEKELLEERDRLHAQLRAYSISVPELSRPLRRGLREQLGRGGHPHVGQQTIHRSQATREIFKKAEHVARLNKSTQLTTSNLLHVLFESPPKEVQIILASMGIRLIKTHPDAPTLNKYGRILGAITADLGAGGEAGQSKDFVKDAVCRVILDIFRKQPKKGILLIQKGTRAPDHVAENLALSLRQPTDQSPVPFERICEIDLTTPTWQLIADKPRNIENTLRMIFDEVITSSDLILFFKELSVFYSFSGGTNCLVLIREQISRGIPCIVGTDERGYHNYYEKDSAWKKICHPVWIHDLNIPFQL